MKYICHLVEYLTPLVWASLPGGGQVAHGFSNVVFDRSYRAFTF